MIGNKTEIELIEEIRNGSEAALKLLLNYYSKKLKFRICVVHGLPEEVAEDIIQNAFIKFYIRRHTYSTEFAFSTYMYKIVDNEVKSFSKRFIKRLFYSFNELFFHSKTNVPLSVENNDTYTFLLSKLSQRDRELIVLKNIQEYSYEEISDMLGIKIGTLKSRHSRALSKLSDIVKALDL